MEKELLRQLLCKSDAYKVSADRMSFNLKTMYLLYDAEILIKGPLKSSLCPDGLRNLAIYGCGNIGIKFASFLKRRGYKIDYFVDRKGGTTSNTDIPCYLPHDLLPSTQLLVVTAEYDYDDIASYMATIMKYPITALSDFLKEQFDAVMHE